ncbi:MAG: hypothetical protein LBM98_12590 [Oscillospiraceae bacterium]|nr:hypothetical protein [Oscillospiraceae bacterium]
MRVLAPVAVFARHPPPLRRHPPLKRGALVGWTGVRRARRGKPPPRLRAVPLHRGDRVWT